MSNGAVRILEDDTAWNFYNSLCWKLQAGETIVDFESQYNKELEYIKKWRTNNNKEELDFEYEVIVTVYAQFLWEIGELKEDFIKIVEEVISKGYGFRFWELNDYPNDAKRRKANLNRFLSKIRKPKKRLRKKIYKPIKNFCFQTGDIIKFENTEGTDILVVSYIYEERNTCFYCFTLIDTENTDILNSDILKGLSYYGVKRYFPKLSSMDSIYTSLISFTIQHKYLRNVKKIFNVLFNVVLKKHFTHYHPNYIFNDKTSLQKELINLKNMFFNQSKMEGERLDYVKLPLEQIVE